MIDGLHKEFSIRLFRRASRSLSKIRRQRSKQLIQMIKVDLKASLLVNVGSIIRKRRESKWT
ncbi:hypothetical protein CP083_01740 [Candidatus Bathyarchaeota archaeon B24-2]|nr:MAG: hypothetical protein CP083_01740 [Candidatus Bathyarchaeota archaeon B24-2]